MSTKAELCSTKCEILDLYRYEGALPPVLAPFLLPELIAVIIPYCVSTRVEEQSVQADNQARWRQLTDPYGVTPPRLQEIALTTALFRMVMLPPPPPHMEITLQVHFSEAHFRLGNWVAVDRIPAIDAPLPLTEEAERSVQTSLDATSALFLTACAPFVPVSKERTEPKNSE